MVYTKDGMINPQYARLLEWLEDMGVPTEHREQYAKDIIEDVEQNTAAVCDECGQVHELDDITA